MERWRLAGLMTVATVLATGCSLLRIPAYFFMGPSTTPPQLVKLAPEGDDKDKEVRVLLLMSIPGEVRPEFLRVDRDLNDVLSSKLNTYFKENKQRVVLMPVKKVEKFKDDHTDWYTMDKAEIGNLFHADYVIVLEIESIDLYERGSNRLMLHGQTSIGVSLVDMKRAEDEPLKTQFVAEFPTKSRGPVQVEEVNLQQFRHDFLESIAKKLAWHFVEHETEQEDF